MHIYIYVYRRLGGESASGHNREIVSFRSCVREHEINPSYLGEFGPMTVFFSSPWPLCGFEIRLIFAGGNIFFVDRFSCAVFVHRGCSSGRRFCILRILFFWHCIRTVLVQMPYVYVAWDLYRVLTCFSLSRFFWRTHFEVD